MHTDFHDAARRLGVELDDEQTTRFRIFRDCLVRSAREFNLTAVRDPHLVETRHFLEAIAFGALLDQRGLLAQGTRMLDLGSGAGLPGLPLKIVWPRMRITLLEATAKKCRFLQMMVAELGLENVAVLQGRAEDLARDPAHREAYSLVVARAVAPLPVLLEYSLPYLEVGGHLAANKGSAAPREVEEAEAALRELGGVIRETLPFYPPEVIGQTIILVRKERATPQRYPRRTGIPSKRPLI